MTTTYWVYPDPANPSCSVFAFPPGDYEIGPDGTHRPVIGERARREIMRWFDYLRRAASAGVPASSKHYDLSYIRIRHRWPPAGLAAGTNRSNFLGKGKYC